jgi:copper(I)-binding protein
MFNQIQEGLMKAIAIVLMLVITSLISSACGSSDSVAVQDAWARPGFQGDNSAVYLVIKNHTDQADGLIGAASDIAGATEIHLSKMDAEGTMTMERQDLVNIPANDSVELSPGGLHIMLVNLGEDLSVGDTFPVTLEFQRAGDITIDVEVRQP